MNRIHMHYLFSAVHTNPLREMRDSDDDSDDDDDDAAEPEDAASDGGLP